MLLNKFFSDVRSVALLIIDAIGFKLYVRKFVDAFRFVVLYCIVVLFFLLFFLSLGDEIKLLKSRSGINNLRLRSCPESTSSISARNHKVSAGVQHRRKWYEYVDL